MIIKVLADLSLRTYRVLHKLEKANYDLTHSSHELADLSIVITTFEKRFEKYALPLIYQIRKVSSAPITLIVNGNYGGPATTTNLKNFLVKISEFPFVYPIVYQEFHGCARMWNDGIYYSQSENILVLNDDLTLIPELFSQAMHASLSQISVEDILVFNKSWSHFLLNKNAILKYGWFDERFIAIGNEDGEYAARFTRITSRYIPTLFVDCFVNVSDLSRDAKVQPAGKKYSIFNETLHNMIHSGVNLPSADVHPYFNWYRDCKKALLESDPENIRRIILQASSHD